MKTFTHTMEIDAAPRQVWACLVDAELLKRWLPPGAAIHYKGGTPVSGDPFNYASKQGNRQKSFPGRVVRADPPGLLQLFFDDKRVRMDVTYRLTAVGAGRARLDYTALIDPQGWLMKAVSAAFASLFAANNRRILARLKSAAESARAR